MCVNAQDTFEELLASHPVTVSVQVTAIARLPYSHRRSTSRPGSGAVRIVDFAPTTALGSCGWACI